MKARKMIAAASALCIAACSALPAAYTASLSAPRLAASAAEATEFTSGPLTYRKSGDDACIISCDKDAVGEIYIPAQVNGLIVVSIADGAFRDCKGITSVQTQPVMTTIGDHAFEDCESLESIELDYGIESIGSYAFAGCTSLKAPDFPNKCEIGSYAFKDCTSFTTIELPSMRKISEGLLEGCTSLTTVTTKYCGTEIGKGAFRNCTKLKSINLEVYAYEELKTIGEEAFAGCGELEELVIPDGVVTLKDNAFAGCTSLNSIGIPDSLTDFSPDVFNDTPWKTNILSQDECFIINDVIYEIPDVEELEIGYGTKRIASGAADSCPSLTTVRIDDRLETIDADAFSKCRNIKDVYYDGFELQWEALKKYSAAEGNEALFENAEVHFREESLLPGDYFTLREGDLTYNIYNDHAEVTSCSGFYEGDIVIPSEVLGLPVTVIGYCAFNLSEQMTSVTIPDSITAIEQHAFGYCTGLTEVTIPDSVEYIDDSAFNNCTGLTGINIPASVKSVGSCAFRGCTSLIEVDLPEPLPEIGSDAFEGTPWLEKYKQETPFIIFEGVLLKYTADGGDVVIPEGVRKIGSGAFVGNDITSVVIPDSVTAIEIDAFLWCKELTAVDIPDSVTYIAPGAFSGTSVSELTIPGGIKQPESGLFSGIETLEKVTYLEGTEIIPEYQFAENKLLRSVSLPDTVTEIGEKAFMGCRRLKDISIPESVTCIGYKAFDSCRSLTSVTIPEGVKELNDTFMNCYALREVSLPASLERISKDTFRHSDALTDIYYAGTEEDWKKLMTASSISSSDNVFYNAVIHFNADAPSSVIYGDANGDGKITVSDAVAVLQYIANAEKYPIDKELLACADCDGESGITGSDAMMIQRFDAGLIDSFPAEKK